MPTITAFPQLIAGITDADAVSENLYAPKGIVPDTFDVLNGWLDRENLPSTAKQIGASQIHPGAYTRLYSTGATANLDLFSDLFPGHPPEFGDNEKNYRPISGAGATCYVPWASSRVLIRWNLAIATDGARSSTTEIYNPQTRGAVLLKQVDPAGTSTPYWSTYRWFSPAYQTAAVPPLPITARHGERHDRVYCGHKVLTGLAKGYHHFNICGWMRGPTTRSSDATGQAHRYQDGMLQMRFRVRGFRVIVLRG
jgi:hypothetical protein